VAESSWPTIAGSRAVTDDQYEVMAAGYTADGVISQWTDSAPVFADSSGRQVKIRANFTAIVAGHGYSSGTSDTIKAVTANASGSTRIDLIVLGLDRTTQAVTAYVKAGTPGAGVPPALLRDARGGGTGKWEIPIGQVSVANGAATLAAATVTNIAWYSRGDTVATVSTSTLQPEATAYPKREHTDTGHVFESVSGVWRRYPWQTAWGVIGGQRYTGGSATPLVTGGGTTEFQVAQTSGSVQLRANRRYRIRGFIRLYQSVSTAVVVLRLRETNLSGTIRAERNVTNANQAVIFDWEVFGEYTVGGADETKTYVVTGVSTAGSWNMYAGSATAQVVGVYVEDIGPASPNAITSV
jgi:hypothetical protein